jgi:hypothetical protein
MGYLGLVSPGESFGPYTLDSTSVIRLWTLFEAAGNSSCISIEPTSGDARLGVALFNPGTGDYFDRDDALAQAVASTGGGSVSIDLLPNKLDSKLPGSYTPNLIQKCF